MGVTVRELNGWSPRTVTLDADGNLLSVAVAAPRFTRHELALLLASRRAESAQRGSHGFLMSEATDPDNQYAFTVPLPTTDFAEKAIIDARKKYAKRWGDEALEGTLWRAEKAD